ncbi:class I SAM-dependent methyltransferase [Haloechinothrix halophila]|uniref:class I SAM-dependent methyltransferase n=1 Tax=Haloechinothrix halophila TaxID=1069073 RepID=UPI00041E8C28|nr:class I SAM-dependent methyltransferase [Haloechinothrix halophila]
MRLLRVVAEVTDRHRRDLEEVIRQQRRELQRELGAVVRDQAKRTAEHTIDDVVGTIRRTDQRGRRDLGAVAQLDAALDSARFAQDTMPTVPTFARPMDTLKHALDMAPTAGMALEFGVYSGKTLQTIARRRNGTNVYGFDSFKGLPEDWRSGFPAGTFDTDGLPEVDGAELVVGWFDETLSGFLAEHPGEVDFLHLDADLYSSTRTVLDLVGPRLHVGSIVVFDEYFNYPGWRKHEHRAWHEYVERTGTSFSYEGYTRNSEQVIVRITGT